MKNVKNVTKIYLLNIAINVEIVILNKQIFNFVISANLAKMDQYNYYIIALIVRNVIEKVNKIICFIVIDANNVMKDKKICILTVKTV